jgi:4-amino-4-deoxy-L-arabinose transferase-like glycosyltransferase
VTGVQGRTDSSAVTASVSSTSISSARRVPASELLIVCAVVLAAGALLVLLSAVHGALGAARNDDWSFYRTAFAFDATHHFRVDGWPQMTLAGHTLLAWPIVALFGHTIIGLQLLGLTAAMVGVVCSYVVVRRFLSPGYAAVACLSLAIGPVLGTLAVSYMTDTTAFGLQVATLAFGVRACESRTPARSGWLLAAVACGLYAFSIREFAIVALVAVFAVAVAGWADRPEERRRLLALAAGACVIALVFYAWRRSVPHSASLSLDLEPGFSAVRQVTRSVITLGLFVSPVALAVSPVRAVRSAWRAHRALTVLVLGADAVCVLAGGATLLGNYVTARGSYPPGSNLRAASNMLPEGVYSLARLVAIYGLVVGSLVLATALAELLASIRAGRGASSVAATARTAPALLMCIVFTVGLALTSLGVIVATKTPFFDRYLIPMVPFLAALLALGGVRYGVLWHAPLKVAAAALAVYAAIGFVYVDTAATVDGANWRAGQQLTDAGLAPATIDAGFAWFGLHQPDRVDPRWEDRHGPLTTRLFSRRPVCATVILHGTDAAARQTARRRTVSTRAEARTLLGRDIVVLGVDGPSRCSKPTESRP